MGNSKKFENWLALIFNNLELEKVRNVPTLLETELEYLIHTDYETIFFLGMFYTFAITSHLHTVHIFWDKTICM